MNRDAMVLTVIGAMLLSSGCAPSPVNSRTETETCIGSDNADNRMIIGVYDVRDMTTWIPAKGASVPDFDKVAALKQRKQDLSDLRIRITNSTPRDSWRSAGGLGSISETGTQFTVTQTKANHAKISDLINKLRKTRGLKHAVSRSLAIEKNYPMESGPIVRKRLDMHIPKLDFEDMELEQVIQFLRDVSGLNIRVRWRALALEGIEPKTPVNVHVRNVTFREVFKAIFADVAAGCKDGGGETGLTYIIDEGVLTVSTRQDLLKRTIACSYDIRDMIVSDDGSEGSRKAHAKGVAEIRAIIEDTLDTVYAKETGPRDGPRTPDADAGKISEKDGQLLIIHTHPGQTQTIMLLNKLRQARGLKGPLKWRRKDESQFFVCDHDITDIMEATTGFAQLLGLRNAADANKYLRGVDEIKQRITGIMHRDSWSDGKGYVSLHPATGQLAIWHTIEKHEKIAQLISKIRKEKGLKDRKPAEIPWHKTVFDPSKWSSDKNVKKH